MKKKILYMTDLYYKAKGRNYYEEDLFITSILKDHFDIVLCNPRNSESYERMEAYEIRSHIRGS